MKNEKKTEQKLSIKYYANLEQGRRKRVWSMLSKSISKRFFRGQKMQNLVGHGVKFAFHFKFNGKPLRSFKEESSMI